MKGVVESPRKAYGEALIALGESDPDMVVMDADLSTSTKTAMFAKKFNDRFFNAGIAEQNMMAMAAGLSIDTRTVFVSTFAIFAAGRAYDQIRQSIAYSSLNVKIVATHGGITVGGDGASHEMIEDIGLMYGLPNMKIFIPVDSNETYNGIISIAKIKGPFYVRLSRMETETITERETEFKINEIPVLREGSDAVIVGTGQVLKRALDVAESLKKQNIDVAVYNMHTIKPVNREEIERIARKYGVIVTIEEHNINTGVGAIISSVTSDVYPVHVVKLGIHDIFGESGEADELMDKYGLSVKDIEEGVKYAMKIRG